VHPRLINILKSDLACQGVFTPAGARSKAKARDSADGFGEIPLASFETSSLNHPEKKNKCR
jgi:hypothetical protein